MVKSDTTRAADGEVLLCCNNLYGSMYNTVTDRVPDSYLNFLNTLAYSAKRYTKNGVPFVSNPLQLDAVYVEV